MTFIKGHAPWNKNKLWSEKIKRKMGIARKRATTKETIDKLRKYNLGRKHTDITKEKHRKAMLQRNNPNWGKFGKEHPCYKENKVHKFHKIIRETFKYRQWRSDIFTRDNFTCVICNKRNCELNADHYPKRFIDIIEEYNIKTLDEAIKCEELWSINNGRTLCVDCHRKTDTWGRQAI